MIRVIYVIGIFPDDQWAIQSWSWKFDPLSPTGSGAQRSFEAWITLIMIFTRCLEIKKLN